MNLRSQDPIYVEKMMEMTKKTKTPKSWQSVSGLLPSGSLGNFLDSDSELASCDISPQSLKILTMSLAVETKPDTQPAIEEIVDCLVSRKVRLGSRWRLDPCRLNLPAWSKESITLHQDISTFLKLECNQINKIT